jgi:hypothetical protein
MKLSLTIMIIYFTFIQVTYSIGSEKKENKNMVRDDLYHIKLSDGSKLSIRTQVESQERHQNLEVWIVRHPKGTLYEKQPVIWGRLLTLVDYEPGKKGYYALVNVMEDRFLIFFTWNGQYCIIGKDNGQILKKGDVDNVLKEYEDLIPLKLLIMLPSTGRTMTEQELKELKQLEEKTMTKQELDEQRKLEKE